MRRSTRRAMIASSLVACATACGLFPDLGDLAGGDASDGTAPFDAPKSESGTDAATDAQLDAPIDVFDAGDGACPSGRGPTMVKVDSKTCIDTTEVTIGQYRAFETTVDASAVAQPPECTWNTTFVPQGGMPGTAKDAFPIAQLNWCQAKAFCDWAGKSLCGTFDGGAVPPGLYASASQSVWMSACSANGTQSYPYGVAFEAGACNLQTGDASAPVSLPGAFAKCTGSLPGMFDMIGNIKEWENSCTPSGTDAAADQCRRRGAGFDELESVKPTCAWDETDTRNHQSFTTGVRCCAYSP